MYRAELLKLRTTRTAWIIAGVALAGMVLIQSLIIALPHLLNGLGGKISSDLPPDMTAELVPDLAALTDLTSPAYQRSMLDLLALGPGGSNTGITVVCVLLLGVLAATTDFRTGGIVPTALVSPSRPRLLAAKAAASATVTLLIGAGLLVLTAAGLVIALATTPGAELVLTPFEVLGVWGRGLVVLVLLTWLGLGLGTLIRGQVAAIVVVGSLVLAEPIIRAMVSLISGGAPTIVDWLPVGLGAVASTGQAMALGGAATVGAVAALAALAAWAFIALAGGAWTFQKRDLA